MDPGEPTHERDVAGDLPAADPRAVRVVTAIRAGDHATLRDLLAARPDLARARVVDGGGCGRTLLHVVTDWPGHHPGGATTVALLVEAGADVDARLRGPTRETPLHWAASSDDVAVLDALLDAGADLEADGAVLGGGGPLADAVGFGNWAAARRLVERGARTDLGQAAALGLLDRVEAALAASPPPGPQLRTMALWHACHGGERATAERLLGAGAAIDWIGWDDRTALDVALDADDPALVAWLRAQGAHTAAQLR